MIRMRCTQAILVGVLMAGGCVSPDSGRLHESLIKTDRQWAEAVRGTDVDRIASFWTDDAVIYTANRPPVAGKKALREFVARNRSIPGFSLGWEVCDVVVSGNGDLAYTLGPYELTVPSAKGGLMTLKGNHICIWRRENGEWRCSLEVHAPLPVADERASGSGSP